MKNVRCHNAKDVKKLTKIELIKKFGKVGKFYYQIVRGIDNREVHPHRETKPLAAEDTFAYDLTTVKEMEAELDKIASIVCIRLQIYQLKGRTITLKIKYRNFKQITRNQSFPVCINDVKTICSKVKRLLALTLPEDKKIRLLGISLSNFMEVVIKQKEGQKQSEQLSLFSA